MIKKISLMICFILLAVVAFMNTARAEGGTATTRIEIVEVGDIDDQILFDLRDSLEKIFGVTVTIITHLPDTDYAYDRSRNQYNSLTILSHLPVPDDKNSKLVGITDHDLYVPGKKFVFGKADAVKGVSIISLARLHQSYYGFTEDRDLFMQRVLKVVAHEVGHLIGLTHSPDDEDVMHPYTKIEEIDCINNYFCIERK